MAVSTDFQKLRSCLNVTQYDFDPGATTATEIAWVDMQESSGILAGFFRTIGTGATTLSLVANSASDGSGTDVTVKTKVLTAAEPNAVGDTTWIEATGDEIAEAAGAAGVEVRYITAVVSVATGTDEGVVTYIRKGKHKKLDLTADVIA